MVARGRSSNSLPAHQDADGSDGDWTADAPQDVVRDHPRIPRGSTDDKILLDLRGVTFDLSRRLVAALPESVLLAMFPDGTFVPWNAESDEDSEWTSESGSSEDDGDSRLGAARGDRKGPTPRPRVRYAGSSEQPDSCDVAHPQEGIADGKPAASESEEGRALLQPQPVYTVDYNPRLLQYVIQRYREVVLRGDGESQKRQSEPSTQRELLELPCLLYHDLRSFATGQPIAVLKEDLDYFVFAFQELDSSGNSLAQHTPVPASASHVLAMAHAYDSATLLEDREIFNNSPAKQLCRDHLIAERKIFAAVKNTPSHCARQRLSAAEDRRVSARQVHVVDMLAAAGFSENDEWGLRASEPCRTSISSLAMAYLPSALDGHRSAPAQRMVQLWKRPVRKCWWTGTTIVSQAGKELKFWSRRTWTLEVVLV